MCDSDVSTKMATAIQEWIKAVDTPCTNPANPNFGRALDDVIAVPGGCKGFGDED